MRLFSCLLLLFALSIASFRPERAYAQEPEFRAFWAGAWHDGFQNREDAVKLISNIRTANCNALILQVRRRGDAYYKGSPFESMAPTLSPGFDPLAEIIKMAHDTNLGPRIEVHAWFVAYPIVTITHIGDNSPVAAAEADIKNPFHQHPEWLTESDDGAKFDGNHYSLDPGHPGVEKYLFDVAMNIISRYDLDGFHLDHLSYPGKNWGYNKTAVARFKSLYHRSQKPSPDDLDWCQFRRDQITSLVRKIYLSSLAKEPKLKISASTLTLVPSATSEDQWQKSFAYGTAFQDWSGWMKEGILDINIPMAFFQQSNPLFASAYLDWCGYAKNHKFNRHVVIGEGGYLNSGNAIAQQILISREVSSKGVKGDGIALYSYAIPSQRSFPGQTVFEALSSTNGRKNSLQGLFANIATIPEMPWKTKPNTGHLMGYVHGESKTDILDGAKVKLSGGLEKDLVTDGTGFYGAVDLPVGSYTIVTQFPGYQARTNKCIVKLGKVCANDVLLRR